MKGFLKTLVLVTLALVLVMTVASCNKSNKNEQTTTDTEEVTTPVENPGQTDPTDSDPVDTDPVDTDPVVTDPIDTDPVDTDPVDTDPVDTDPVDTDPVDTDPVDTDPGDNPGEIDPPAHEHSYEAAVTAPTCTAGGYTTYTCACGDSYVADEVDALGHSYEAAVTAPDCTNGGYTTYTCACGDSYVADEVGALGHSYEAAVTAPDCTNGGYTTYTCACGDSYVADETDALGHSGYEADYKCDVCSAIVAPAANEALTLAQANTLGMVYGKDVYSTDKYYVTGVITKIVNAKYGNVYITDAEGTSFYIYGLNSFDGETPYENLTYKPGLGDEITVWGVIGTHDGKAAQMKEGWIDEIVACEHVYEVISSTEASCTANGSIVKRCTVCNLNEVTETIPATGHDYHEGTCNNCGGAYKATETIEFDFGANGTNTEHVDGSEISSGKSYTVGSYTLTLTDVSKVYAGAYDLMHNSCLKLGTSKLNGSFTFTVPDDVNKVIIYAAKYKANATTVDINGTKYTLTKSCNDGEYDAIEIDTTSTKTITFKTDGSTYRAMINTIAFVVGVPCEHTYSNDCDNICNICGETRDAGHNYEAAVTAPDCENGGYTTYTCSACGDSYVADETDALGHSYEAAVTAPDCENGGYTTYTCACGDSYVADEVAALGHSYKAVVTEATCETAGYTTYTCSVCDDSYVADEVEAYGHEAGAAATCTNNQTCIRCNYIFVEAFGHNFVDGFCANEGCGVSDGHVCEYNAVVTEATCTTAGYTTYTCPTCKKTYTEDGEDALGHAWDNDCDTDCNNNCGETREIEHAYEAAVTEATCEAAGYTTYTCSICGNSYTEDGDEALGHAWDNDCDTDCNNNCGIIRETDHYYEAVVTDPNCEAAGYTTYTCPLCNDTYTEDGDAALGHTPGAEATCTTAQLCNVCGAELVAALGHVWVDNNCSVCDSVISTELEVTFDFGANGTNTEHVDGNDLGASKTYTVGDYKLNLTGMSKVYGPAYDLKHNSCIKLGTSSATAAFSFTVPENVTKVVIYVAGYKANKASINVNGTTYSISTTSNNGEYTAIEIDTTTQKTINFSTNSTPDERAMINTIEFYATVIHKYEVTATTDATCTAAATKTETCTICGKVVTTETAPANGHDYEADVTDPDCVNGGYTTYTCSVCDDTYIADATEALGHTSSDWIVDVEATEDTDGSQHKECTVCGEILETEIIPAESHVCEYTEEVTDPTCENEGYTTYTCSGCGDTYTDNVVEALGHDYASNVTDPTCAADGYTTYTCSACNDTYTADPVPATGAHTYENGNCSVCGAKDPSAEPTVVLEITKSDFNSTSYAANNNTKTKNGYSYTTNQIMNQSSVMQWKKNEGYISIASNQFVKLDIKVTSGTFTVKVGGTTVTGTTANGVTTYDLTGLTGEVKISVGSATGKVDYIKFYA